MTKLQLAEMATIIRTVVDGCEANSPHDVVLARALRSSAATLDVLARG